MAARLGIRRARRRKPVGFRLHKAPWIDPYPGIPGTEPEKRLFQALMRRHIYFVFQGDLPELKEKDLPVLWQVGYKPDFVLPEYKVIIDPFGIYHHTLPEAIKRDTMKSIVYRGAGYAFYHPWWSERGWEWNQAVAWLDSGGKRRFHSGGWDPMGTDTLALLDRIPELRRGPRFPLKDPKDIEAKRMYGYRIGKNIGAGANSVALANRKRKRAPVIALRSAGRRRRRRRV